MVENSGIRLLQKGATSTARDRPDEVFRRDWHHPGKVCAQCHVGFFFIFVIVAPEIERRALREIVARSAALVRAPLAFRASFATATRGGRDVRSVQNGCAASGGLPFRGCRGVEALRGRGEGGAATRGGGG